MADERIDALVREAMNAWRPPPRLTLSTWADAHFVLSAESSAETGRWKTLPYQVGIMDAITDPTVEQVSVMKSARVGYTKIIDATIGYYIDQAPCSILVVQPTVEDAKGFSKEEIAPMLRDVPRLARVVIEEAEEVGPRDSGNTILHKKFPGGVLSLVGANSGTGFRRVSRKVVLFDEVDAYPPSAGQEGDQIQLGIKRTEYFWDRKIVAGSTPLIAGASRIEELFDAGDRRRYYVPCPQCGFMDFLVFKQGDRGHWMRWPDKRPEAAHFVCFKCGKEIEHRHKREIVGAGEWRAEAPFKGHASFHLWAALSFSPNATWAHLAKEFLATNDRPEQLKVFVNTALGETWQEKGEAPDWKKLHERPKRYKKGDVAAAAVAITAGVDVQADRLVCELVAWGEDKQSWSIEAIVFPGDTSSEENPVWANLDALLGREWMTAGGELLSIRMLAIDSGYNTQTVYNWARRHPLSRVIACKGATGARAIIGSPSKVDVTIRGTKRKRGYQVWPIGVDMAKSELYGWLRLELGENNAAPPGYCHFPEEYDAEYFKQITAEHLVKVVSKRTRFTKLEWQLLPGRQNHFLDCRIYARAAASLLGLDVLAASKRRAPPSAAAASPPAPAPAPPAPTHASRPSEPAREPQPSSEGGWLGGRRPIAGRGNWLNRRR